MLTDQDNNDLSIISTSPVSLFFREENCEQAIFLLRFRNKTMRELLISQVECRFFLIKRRTLTFLAIKLNDANVTIKSKNSVGFLYSLYDFLVENKSGLKVVIEFNIYY